MVSYEVYSFPHPILSTPVNIVVLGTGRGVVVVDTGPSPFSLKEVVDRQEPDLVLLTHYHWDHSFGLVGLTRSIPVCAASTTIEYLSSVKRIEELTRSIVVLAGGGEEEVRMFRQIFGSMYAEISRAASRLLRLEECSHLLSSNGMEYFSCPGHTFCHVCYLARADEERVVVVGDNVLEGESPPILDVINYLESLLRLCEKEWDILVPGHGKPMERDRACRVVVGIATRKYQRLQRLVEILLERGRADSLSLLHGVYGSGAASPVEYFARAYSLYGYLHSLAEEGAVALIEEEGPVEVVLRNSSRAGVVLRRAEELVEEIESYV